MSKCNVPPKIRSMKNKTCLAASIAFSLAGVLTPAMADVHLSPLFCDGAVLQRGMDVPVWGTADAGEAVTVSINGKQAKAVADASGKWMLKLPSQAAGGPFDLTAAGKNTVVVKNVAVGEVWVASGQSNMEFPLQTYAPNDPVYGPKAKEEIAAVNDPLLRMFTVIKKVSPDAPVDNMAGPQGSWKVATPQDAAKFSAVGYYYARELRSKLNVPVGIIHSSWGGSPAEAWTSQSVLAGDPKLKMFLDIWEKKMATYPADIKTFEEVTFPAWKQAAEKAKAEGQPEPKRPWPPLSPTDFHRSTTLFNGMISPLIPYGIKGAIWYQGESNANDPLHYRILFPAMIQDWRTRWNQGAFPFLFVQLANYMAPQTKPAEGGWAGLREAQMMTLSLQNTGMASAIDLADPEKPGDIHPHNKQEVGRRLSLNALATVYGEKIPSYSGPLYSGFKVNGKEVRLNFTHTDGGLVAKGEKLNGFAIAGADRKFVWANAKIEGDAVVVSSDEVPEPKAVRYSWASNPIGNLFNKEGLPASSFRTDTDSPN